MNKAFVREPDSDDFRCPHCEALGTDVTATTIAAHVQPAAAERMSSGGSYCPTPTCDVVYFDAFERVITTADLLHPVYPKDPDAPICPCFGGTCAEIEADLAEGSVLRVRRLVQQARSPQAECTLRNVHGRSCEAEVQRYYMQRRK